MTIRIEFDITCLCPMYSTCYFHSGISQEFVNANAGKSVVVEGNRFERCDKSLRGNAISAINGVSVHDLNNVFG